MIKISRKTATYLCVSSIFFLGLIAISCGGGGGGGSGGGSSSTTSDYQYLYARNAYALGGYTVRWASNTVGVYAPEFPEAQAAFNRWANSSLQFSFGLTGNVEMYWSNNLPSNVCGRAYYNYFTSGTMFKSLIYINSNIVDSCYGGLSHIITHEAAHALGFFGHDPAGTSIMGPYARGGITSQNRRFFQLLYGSPAGTNINGKLGKKRLGKSSVFSKNGTRIIRGFIDWSAPCSKCSR